ncbi:MAG: mannose-1-phosphate guanylyltransferase [Pseudomonadota bacterium]
MALLDKTFVIIMAGGKGTRFWPASRKKHPKQFLKILGKQSMLQLTCDRMIQVVSLQNIYVVTEAGFKDEVAKQLPELPPKNILEEPMGKSTAAAIGYAAVTITREVPDATLILLPSDHYIGDLHEFTNTMKTVSGYAQDNDVLCTLGVKPTSPETGYGYIHLGNRFEKVGDYKIFQVENFVEKPDLYTAIRYLEDGKYYWNSGIFVFSAKALFESIIAYMPKLWQGLENVIKLPFPYPGDELNKIYSDFENISIDYGIMEKADNVQCMPASFIWSDTGSWTSLENFLEKDEEGNMTHGDVINLGCTNCIIVGNESMTAAINVHDLIIVSSPNAVLVSNKENAQEVKKVVEQLEKDAKEKYL